MKKKIAAALAATFALGVTSAFAANPFSDVEAKHWAYDSVAKLAKAGIIDGYGDGTFRGDRTMTRYEMAQIVAKAMARSDKANAEQKAMLNKLSAEFSSELNNLGVRVGALEKKVGTIKITGDARVRWMQERASDATPTGWHMRQDSKFSERLRLNMNADINDNTSFYGRIIAQDHNKMGTTGADRLYISDAAFTTKGVLGDKNTNVTVGRFSQKMLTLGNWMDTAGMVDGIKVTTGSDRFKATIGYADFSAAGVSGQWDRVNRNLQYTYYGSDIYWVREKIKQAGFVDLSYKASKATTIGAMYFSGKHATTNEHSGTGNFIYTMLPDRTVKYWGIGFDTKFAKDWSLAGEYVKSDATYYHFVNLSLNTHKPVFQSYRLSYKGVQPTVQGSWGMWLEYVKSDVGANIGAFSGSFSRMEQVKGWNIGVQYALAKNVTLDAIHQFSNKNTCGYEHVGNADLAAMKADDYKRTRVQVNYLF